MKLKIELELDMASYNAKYGPGSEWQKRHYPEGTPEDHGQNKPDWAEAMVKDMLHEGFYDWDCLGALNLQVQQG